MPYRVTASTKPGPTSLRACPSFAGATGILYLPAYLTRERPAIRMIAALVALVIFAITG
jgi:hypothetical protein